MTYKLIMLKFGFSYLCFIQYIVSVFKFLLFHKSLSFFVLFQPIKPRKSSPTDNFLQLTKPLNIWFVPI